MRKFARIFGIGLSRTGTHSLSYALLKLGLKVVHFPADIHEIMAHDAATDSRIAAQFDVLDLYIPGSLFILTERDLDGWLASCERFWASFNQFAGSEAVRAFHRQLYGSADFDRDMFAEAYARHLTRVENHFAARSEALLRLNICAGEGWEKLAPFLDVAPPSEPFPHDRAPGGQ